MLEQIRNTLILETLRELNKDNINEIHLKIIALIMVFEEAPVQSL